MNIKIKGIIFTCIITFLVVLPSRATCTIDMSVIQISHDSEIPQESLDHLSQRLQSICGQFSFDTNDSSSRFFIAGRFSNSYMNLLPGPPQQTALHTTLTIYIGDLEAKKIFSSISIELRGVGTSPQRAYINALKPISTNNQKLESFMDEAHESIINYYDESFPSIKLQVRDAELHQDYQRALWLLSLVPSCSSKYQESSELAIPLIKKHFDKQGESLLLAAKTSWASTPNRQGAEYALEYIRQIDPSSKAFPAAQELIKEIKDKNIADLDFEYHYKYETELALQNSALEVARSIGVAYGKGQKTDINIFEFTNDF